MWLYSADLIFQIVTSKSTIKWNTSGLEVVSNKPIVNEEDEHV
jgi:hypothetical protein